MNFTFEKQTFEGFKDSHLWFRLLYAFLSMACIKWTEDIPIHRQKMRYPLSSHWCSELLVPLPGRKHNSSSTVTPSQLAIMVQNCISACHSADLFQTIQYKTGKSIFIHFLCFTRKFKSQSLVHQFEKSIFHHLYLDWHLVLHMLCTLIYYLPGYTFLLKKTRIIFLSYWYISRHYSGIRQY